MGQQVVAKALQTVLVRDYQEAHPTGHDRFRQREKVWPLNGESPADLGRPLVHRHAACRTELLYHLPLVPQAGF
jgi:hypothetical protein